MPEFANLFKIIMKVRCYILYIVSRNEWMIVISYNSRNNLYFYD